MIEPPEYIIKTICDMLSPYIKITSHEFIQKLTHSNQVNKVDRLLTLKESADVLSVSTRHLYNLNDRGDLPFVHIGKSVRIKESEIQKLINK